MAEGQFRIEVVSPEAALFEGDVTAVVLRSSDGELTVLDGHTDLVTDVVPGEVRLDRDEGQVRLAVHGGYLQVESGTRTDGGRPEGAEDTGEPGARVTLLAGVAELADQIDVPRAEQAKAAAEARVEELAAAGSRSGDRSGETSGEGAPEDVELARARAALSRAEVRLQVAGAAAPT